MSRGGFRGRGRGGGRGGMPSIPGMSHETWKDMMGGPSKHTGKLYPPLDTESIAFLPTPSEAEDLMVRKETELDDILRRGLVDDEAQGTRWCGWRLPETRKTVGIEIETYSDIIARPSISSPQDDKLDPDKLKLDPRFFPPSLWDAYFAPEKEVKRVQAKAGQAKKRKRILDSDDEKDVDEAEKGSAKGSEEEDEDYEDESDHQDYDANYFDNGEGDDDEGGEDEDGGGGNFDD